MKWWGTWRLLYPELSDAQTLELSENVLRQLWKWVFVGSAFNGWFLLTSQMHFVEALHNRVLLGRSFGDLVDQGELFDHVVLLDRHLRIIGGLE